jgi:prolipoprotein diacylglyceryltransferase
LIPCWPQPALHIGHATLYAHGVLLALGTAVGAIVFLKRAEAFSLSKKTAMRFILLFVPIASLGSHLMYCAFDDSSSFFKFAGISSFGGILACLLIFPLCVCQREHPWRWFDAASTAAIYAALIARLGCFLAHDRIGAPTSFWLSVNCADGPSYDLALFEMTFLAISVTVLLCAEWQQWHRPDGVTFAMLALSYGLFRLVLGQLVDMPSRYYGLIQEQFGAVVLIVVGAGCFRLISQRSQPGEKS